LAHKTPVVLMRLLSAQAEMVEQQAASCLNNGGEREKEKQHAE